MQSVQREDSIAAQSVSFLMEWTGKHNRHWVSSISNFRVAMFHVLLTELATFKWSGVYATAPLVVEKASFILMANFYWPNNSQYLT